MLFEAAVFGIPPGIPILQTTSVHANSETWIHVRCPQLSATVLLGTFACSGHCSIFHPPSPSGYPSGSPSIGTPSCNSRTPLEGPFFSTSFSDTSKKNNNPKVCSRLPTCVQNGCQSEFWRVQKNVFVSSSMKKCRHLPNLIIYDVS